MDAGRGVQTKASETQTDATPTEVLGALVSETVLAKATSLARSGQYATAEKLLQRLINSENPEAMDLVARIHAQQRQFSEAEAL